MTSNPIIVSVPQCGTRFLKERLGIEEHVHTLVPWGTLWERTEGRPIIVPLRKPADSWRSWCRRHDSDNFPYADWFMAWGVLHALDQMCDLDVICIDQQTDQRITDWSPVGQGDNSRADWKLIKVDLRAVCKLPIVERHYSSLAKAA